MKTQIKKRCTSVNCNNVIANHPYNFKAAYCESCKKEIRNILNDLINKV